MVVFTIMKMLVELVWRRICYEVSGWVQLDIVDKILRTDTNELDPCKNNVNYYDSKFTGK